MWRPAPFSLRGTVLPIPLILALLVLAGALFPRPLHAEGRRLARIRYQRSGQEMEGIGEVLYGSGQRLQLRLFSDRLADYYEVHLELTELLDVDPLTREESQQLCRSWDLRRDEERRRRAEESRRERAKRAAERRVAAGSKSKSKARVRGSAKGRREGSRRQTRAGRRARSDLPAGRSSGARPELAVVHLSPEELLIDLFDAARGKIDRLAEVRRGLSAQLAELGDLLKTGTSPPPRARALRSRLDDLDERLTRLEGRIQRRGQAVERIGPLVTSGEMPEKEFRERAVLILRQLAAADTELVRLEGLVAAGATSLHALDRSAPASTGEEPDRPDPDAEVEGDRQEPAAAAGARIAAASAASLEDDDPRPSALITRVSARKPPGSPPAGEPERPGVVEEADEGSASQSAPGESTEPGGIGIAAGALAIFLIGLLLLAGRRGRVRTVEGSVAEGDHRPAAVRAGATTR
ncbi:MAG: hypothetical protein ACE5GW_10645 [Planctomycetota bacterium]